MQSEAAQQDKVAKLPPIFLTIIGFANSLVDVKIVIRTDIAFASAVSLCGAFTWTTKIAAAFGRS